MVSTTGHHRHDSQTVVASAGVASSFLECCVLMFCPRPFYLAWFDRGGMVLASCTCLIDLQGLKKHSFIHILGLKRFKSEIKIETSKH